MIGPITRANYPSPVHQISEANEEVYLTRLETLLKEMGKLKKDATISELFKIDLALDEQKKVLINKIILQISLILEVIDELKDKQRVYHALFCFFPFIDKDHLKLFIKPTTSHQGTITKASPFQELLAYTPDLHVEQRRLCLLLAVWHLQHSQDYLSFEERLTFYEQTMNYYALAIQIRENDNESFLPLFSKLILEMTKDCLKIRLEKAKEKDSYSIFNLLGEETEDKSYFLEVFAHIEHQKNLFSAEDHKKVLDDLYVIAGGVYKNFTPDLKRYYSSCIPTILGDKEQKQDPSCKISVSSISHSYSMKLKEYRALFQHLISYPATAILENKIPYIRNQQTTITEKLRELCQLILTDAFLIVGPPPCSYDIRALGSVGREEPSSSSDIELMILFKEEGQEEYFKTLTHVLNFLIISLGEINLTPLVFTCLESKNLCGFRLDPGVNPTKDPQLMGTPQQVAKLQQEAAAPQTTAQMVRKSISLHTSDASLFASYQAELNSLLDNSKNPRQQRFGLELFKQRLEDFKDKSCWKEVNFQIFDIKKQFINPFHLLSDMSFYWGIEKTNTLDIIQALVEKKHVFTQISGQLLQETWIAIYQIRVRLHDVYGRQHEEAFSSSRKDLHASQSRGILREDEQKQLEKCYWLVLRPLYHFLDHFFSKHEHEIEHKIFEKSFDTAQWAFREILSDKNVDLKLYQLQKLSLLAGPAVIQESLRAFLSDCPDFQVVIFKEFDLSAKDVADLIKYAWVKERTIALHFQSEHLFIDQSKIQEHIREMIKKSDLFYTQIFHLLEADLKEKDASKQNLLHLAASQGNKQLLLFLLDKGGNGNINEKESHGFTPLSIAAQKGIKSNLDILIEYDAKLEVEDFNKYTPLHHAVLQGHIEVVSFLIIQSANKLAVTREGETILHIAAAKGYLPILELILKTTPELLHYKDNDGKTALHQVLRYCGHASIVKALLEAGANVNEKNSYDFIPLHWAAMLGQLESAKLLIDKGADLNRVNKNGDTPLDLALRWQHDTIVHLLIDPKNPLLQRLTSSSPPKDPRILVEDKEEDLYTRFEQAYVKGKTVDQLFFLEKLAYYYKNKKDYITTAHVLNNALAAAQFYKIDNRYQKLLLTKLESLEGYFLEELLKTKTPASHRNYIIFYRNQLTSIRKKIETCLKTPVEVEKFQKEMSSSFENILINLFQDCCNFLGPTPTSFAILGLSSMSRYEMCPYSQIKIAILIKKDNPTIRIYFRNFIRLLEIKIINLGETLYPLQPTKENHYIFEPKSFTSQGFSLDLKGFTLLRKQERDELIVPPNQLANFQSPVWLEKNKSKIELVNTLIGGRYLFGENSIVEHYEKCYQNILNQKDGFFGKSLYQKRALAILQNHFEEFNIKLEEGCIHLQNLDIKRDLYHPFHLIISSLACYFNLKVSHTLEQISLLCEKKIFSQPVAQSLIKALKQVLDLRIKAHLFYKSNQEKVYSLSDQIYSMSQSFFTLTPERVQILIEIYQVLIPFHEAAEAFTKGQEDIFLISHLEDRKVKNIHLDTEKQFNYEEVLTYIQTVTLKAENEETLQHSPSLNFAFDP